MLIIFISTREYSMFGNESYHYLFVLGTGDNNFREYFCKNEKFRGGMHTEEFDSGVWCTPGSLNYEKIKVENLVTHSL